MIDKRVPIRIIICNKIRLVSKVIKQYANCLIIIMCNKFT